MCLALLQLCIDSAKYPRHSWAKATGQAALNVQRFMRFCLSSDANTEQAKQASHLKMM
jgi:hypothetical protein